MAELVVPPLVRARLAAHALSPGAGDEPLDQVRLLTGAIRRCLLKRRVRSFGARLGGHLGVREYDAAFQLLRLSEIALVKRLPILVIAVQGVPALRILYMSATWKWAEVQRFEGH